MSRTSSFCRWVATPVAAVAVLLVLAACTTSSSLGSPSSSATPSQSASVPSAPPSRQSVRLSCADAGSASEPTGNSGLTVGDLTLEGLLGNVVGSPPADVGLSVPPGETLYFFKTPVWLKAGAAATIELPPTSGGYLVWVPARIWTGVNGGGVDLAPWLTSKLVFDGCPDRDSTYFGGLMSTDRNMCLKLHIVLASGESQQFSVGSAAQC
jgi:hypothetical protein